MENLDYWRLCHELSIKDAASLLIGIDPNEGIPSERLSAFEAAVKAISNALRAKAVDGRAIYNICDHYGNRNDPIDDSLNIEMSRVNVESLREWLKARGFRTGFFFPEAANNEPDYLDPNHPRYAPKLAAAVRAWQAVVDPRGKSPKNALMKWLREHAAEFGLSDDEGKPNETAIEEIAKVANWQPQGGVPKTPGE